MAGEVASKPLAVVNFATGAQAAKRFAGVSAAGRIVREIALAGIYEIWLVVPGGAVDDAARDDIERLAAPSAVRIEPEPPGEGDGRMAIEFAPNRLPEAAAIREFLAGDDAALARDALELDGHAARALLRRTGKPSDGVVSRWINRPISRAISAPLLHIPGVRPLHATIGTALLALAMIAALLTATPAGLLAGALLFQAASVFDGVDGEIARVTFRTSPAGAALDSAIDMATNVVFLAGLTYNLTAQGVTAALYLGLWSIGAVLVGLWLIGRRTVEAGKPLGFDLIKQRLQKHEAGLILRAAIAGGTMISSRDGFAFLFAVLTASGLALVALGIFAFGALIWIVVVLSSTLRGSAAAPLADGQARVR